MTTILVACCWMLFSPLGYVAWRWANRRMGDTWTRNDRLFGIVASLFYGPVMPVMAALLVLVYRLATSKWGNQDAGW